MPEWWRVVYACVLIVSIAAALRLMRGRQRRLDLTRQQRILIGGAAFVGSMIGSKVPFLGDRGWEAFYDGTVWFADGAMACYMILVASVDSSWFDSNHNTPVLTQAITLCSLASTGLVLGQIVRAARRMADSFLERYHKRTRVNAGFVMKTSAFRTHLQSRAT